MRPYNPDGSKLRKLQLWVKQLIGLTPPAFYGRSLSGGILRRMFGSNSGKAGYHPLPHGIVAVPPNTTPLHMTKCVNVF